MINMLKPFALVALGFIVVYGSSCGSARNSLYFSDSSNSKVVATTEPITTKYEPVIQSDDILAINVASISSITTDKAGTVDPTKLYNMGGTNFTLTAGNNQASSNGGYLVNAQGNINFPVLGDVKVAGLKITDAKHLLEDKLKTHLKDPVVEVRIINYKVTVLGEVAHPGQVLAPNHNITILDAVAATGDIPITGRKDNIKIIREINGQRQYATIDLTKRDIMNSPYYYLKQNDILIVDANKYKKQESTSFTRIWLPISSTLLSVGIGITSLILLNSRK